MSYTDVVYVAATPNAKFNKHNASLKGRLLQVLRYLRGEGWNREYIDATLILGARDIHIGSDWSGLPITENRKAIVATHLEASYICNSLQIERLIKDRPVSVLKPDLVIQIKNSKIVSVTESEQKGI